MTRERTKELLENGVLKAWAEGGEVEWQDKNHVKLGYPEWHEAQSESPSFYSAHLQFRVKPKPREFWIATTDYGTIIAFTSREEMEEWKKRADPKFEVIHAIETNP